MLAKQRLDADPVLAELASRYDDARDEVRYRFDPEAYLVERLGWQPWRGSRDAPGQADVLDAYALALTQLHERRDVELAGGAWSDPIRNILRVEAGHAVGKTTLAAGIVSHFFDSFSPSVVYCFAPSHDQINDLLFKEIRKQRAGRGLPGRVLDTPEIKHTGDHFVKGRATNDNHGRGTERVQGQHEAHLLFVIDEAEGVAEFVYDAIKSMTSGGIAIVLMLANPRTRTSRFHRFKDHANVANFRISCLSHPNVLANADVIPGAVRREYVLAMIDDGSEQHAEQVAAHNPDTHTFELPWQPGIVYQPDAEFLFRVLGIAPANLADNTFVPVGRYEAATTRAPIAHDPHVARLGVDVARYGRDAGTLYRRWDGRIERRATFQQQDSNEYARLIKAEALALARHGVTSLHIRIDNGGGFGGAVEDRLKVDEELRRAFADFRIVMVDFGGTPHTADAYADNATEMYAHTAEALKGLALVNPPLFLEGDLCERTYTYVYKAGKEVKKLTEKEQFKRKLGRSPDDGDGCVLAVAPDFMFGGGGGVYI